MIIEDEQAGFREQHTIIDQIFCLHTLMTKYLRHKGGRFYALFVDFEIRKIAVCFLWLSLPGHYRVHNEALLAETT